MPCKTIYILRHFKVLQTPLPSTHSKKLNSQEFMQWVEQYDIDALAYKDVTLPTVDKVYVSTQQRAINTANHLGLRYEKTALLKEVDATPLFKTNMRFSKMFWLGLGRLFWLLNLTKIEKKRDTDKRVKAFLECLQSSQQERVLVVSHGLFLKVLIQALHKQGFQGEAPLRLENAKVYSFNKKEA